MFSNVNNLLTLLTELYNTQGLDSLANIHTNAFDACRDKRNTVIPGTIHVDRKLSAKEQNF